MSSKNSRLWNFKAFGSLYHEWAIEVKNKMCHRTKKNLGRKFLPLNYEA